DERGNVVGLLDTVVDTTEKVLAERVASKERERQKSMLQQMPGFAALLSGPTHVYTYVNDAFIKTVGPRKLIGLSVREAFPELEDQGYYELLDGVFASGKALRANAIPLRLEGDIEQRF